MLLPCRDGAMWPFILSLPGCKTQKEKQKAKPFSLIKPHAFFLLFNLMGDLSE